MPRKRQAYVGSTHWAPDGTRATCGWGKRPKVIDVDEFMRSAKPCKNCMAVAVTRKTGKPRGFPGQLVDMRRAAASGKEGAA